MDTVKEIIKTFPVTAILFIILSIPIFYIKAFFH